jgi:hypothetical protein
MNWMALPLASPGFPVDKAVDKVVDKFVNCTLCVDNMG